MAPPETSTTCLCCDETDTRICDRCKSIRYCSKTCQKKDWPTHKLLCAQFAAFDKNTRPSTDHVLAILFPVDEQKPKLCWLHCPWRNDYEVPWQCAIVGPLLGCETGEATVVYFGRSVPLQRDLRNVIFLRYRDAFLEDGSLPNRSVATILSNKQGDYVEWRGPLVAYSKKGTDVNSPFCRDIDLSSFKHLVDYFLTYEKHSTHYHTGWRIHKLFEDEEEA